MDFLYLIIFFQILIESFPVSSSGHVELINLFLFKFFNININTPDFFDHFLHGPTVLILIIFFRKDWVTPVRFLVSGFFNKIFFRKNSYKNLLKIFYKIILFVFITSLITCGFWVIKSVMGESFFSNNYILLFGFFLTFILLFSLKYNNKINKVLCHKTLFINGIILGLTQGVALLIPGLSRFGSTYVVARWLSISPRRAFQISFLMEFPLILAGFGLGFLKLIRTDSWINLFDFKVNLAFLLGTILSFFALGFMKYLSDKNKFYKISYYMIIPIILTILFIFK